MGTTHDNQNRPRSTEDVAAIRPLIRRPCVDVAELFAGCQEVSLIFGDEEYRLRITRNNKLILTK